MKELKLYVLERCPYCIKVANLIKEKGLDVEILDVNVPENQDALMRIGGQDMVPMLTIDGEPMYESKEIIKWLNENY